MRRRAGRLVLWLLVLLLILAGCWQTPTTVPVLPMRESPTLRLPPAPVPAPSDEPLCACGHEDDVERLLGSSTIWEKARPPL